MSGGARGGVTPPAAGLDAAGLDAAGAAVAAGRLAAAPGRGVAWCPWPRAARTPG